VAPPSSECASIGCAVKKLASDHTSSTPAKASLNVPRGAGGTLRQLTPPSCVT